MTDTTYGASAPAAEPAEPKKSVTKRDVTAAIASFAPAEAPQPTPAEKERANRKARLSTKVRALVADLQALGVDEGTPADALSAFRALATVEKKAASAIDSLTDTKLGLAAERPKTERQPRAPKAEVPSNTPDPKITDQEPAGAPETAADLAYGDEGEVAQPSEETPEQMDSRLAAERAERGAPTRSGPPQNGTSSASPQTPSSDGF